MAMPKPMPAQGSYIPREDREEAAHRVATGQIGGGYGPYSVSPSAQLLLQANCPAVLRDSHTRPIVPPKREC